MFKDDEKINVLAISAITAIIVLAVFFLDTTLSIESSDVPPQIIKNSTMDAGLNRQPDERVAIYSWVDSSGTINYSNKPVLNNKQVLKVVYVDKNINVINMPKLEPDINSLKIYKKPKASNADSIEINPYENICKRFKKWSLDYRDCRARVHTNLKKNCFSLRSKLNQAAGDEYQTLKKLENRVCLAYEKYAIID